MTADVYPRALRRYLQSVNEVLHALHNIANTTNKSYSNAPGLDTVISSLPLHSLHRGRYQISQH